MTCPTCHLPTYGFQVINGKCPSCRRLAASVSLDEDCSSFGHPKASIQGELQLDTGVFTEGHLFLREIQLAVSVDVCTWTCSWPINTSFIKRVIIGARNRKEIDIRGFKGKARYHPSIHAKIYLCYDERHNLTQAYVGSQNFVEPTLCDLMIQVKNASQREAIALYYERLWNASMPLREPPAPKDVRVSGVQPKQEKPNNET